MSRIHFFFFSSSCLCYLFINRAFVFVSCLCRLAVKEKKKKKQTRLQSCVRRYHHQRRWSVYHNQTTTGGRTRGRLRIRQVVDTWPRATFLFVLKQNYRSTELSSSVYYNPATRRENHLGGSRGGVLYADIDGLGAARAEPSANMQVMQRMQSVTLRMSPSQSQQCRQ